MIAWIASTAFAGSVFINGVNVDGLRSQSFEDVTVHIDADGNVRIDAPGYEIEVVDPQATASTGAQTQTPPPPPAPTGVPEARWWLVTEDNASSGHEATVWLNGQQVKTLRSGEPQIIFDLAPYLRPGANDVKITSESTSASGGTFYLYLGSGSNESGTLVMDTPQVQFGLGSSRQGHYERTYKLLVD